MPPLSTLIRPGRVHEAMGAGGRVFALALALGLAGPVIWLQERRARAMLCPQGVAPLVDPARLILVRAPDGLALLQLVEEALRSGAAPLVVAELGQAPDLTASRRLQLAAGAGGGRGLCLLPEGGARNTAAETRWLCLPVPGEGGGAGQLWELVKNKRGRLGAWLVDPLAGDAGTGGREAGAGRRQIAGGGEADPAAPAPRGARIGVPVGVERPGLGGPAPVPG